MVTSVPVGSDAALIQDTHRSSSNGADSAELCGLGDQGNEPVLHGEAAMGSGGIKDMVGQVVQHVLPGPLVRCAVRPVAVHRDISRKAENEHVEHLVGQLYSRPGLWISLNKDRPS